MTEIVPSLNKVLLNAPFDLKLNAVFNAGMEPTEHPDWSLITNLGGAAKVAELLELPKEGGVQRVQNWKFRGIPPGVKLLRPDLFLPGMTATPAPPAAEPAQAEQGP